MPLKPQGIGLKLVLGTVIPGLAVSGMLGWTLWRALREGMTGGEGVLQGGAAGLMILIVLPAALTLVVVHLVVSVRLKSLLEAMRRAEEGDFLVRVPDRGMDEVAEVGRSFNRLLSRLIDVRAEEIDQRRSLDAVQAELALQKTLEHRVQELTLLYGMARQLTSTLSLEELLDRIIALVHEKLQIPLFSVMLVNAEGRLELRKAFPREREEEMEGLVFDIGEGACGLAAEQCEPLYIPDVSADTTTYVHTPQTGPASGSLLCIPMIHAGTLLGVLNFERPEVDGFSANQRDALITAAEMVSLAVRNARLHEETLTLSLTDALTGLANRRSVFLRLDEELARLARYGQRLSLIMIDVDHFKRLNDAAGHRAGDETLQEFSSILRSQVRRVDLLARYGGEEFMVLLPETDGGTAVEIAEKLRTRVEAHAFRHGANQPGGRLTASFGIATAPLDAMESGALVDLADAALYASKRGGRNRVTAYEAGMEFHPGRERGPGPHPSQVASKVVAATIS
ncbi:MAG TPA: diguanylate cyclase [Myxococcaceae bacterium]|nr:diguanylate cyclase [Myxococcaceae bacterium]